MNIVVELLAAIGDDNSVPRNVRSKVNETITCIQENNGTSIDITVDKAIQYLDELSNDPNIPMFTRTQLWSAISALESK